MLLFCNLIQRLKSSKPYSTVFLSEVFSVLFDNLTYKERNLVNCFFINLVSIYSSCFDSCY